MDTKEKKKKVRMHLQIKEWKNYLRCYSENTEKNQIDLNIEYLICEKQ